MLSALRWVGLMLGVGALVLAGCSSGSTDNPGKADAVNTATSSGEVFLEPAAEVGPDPFTQSAVEVTPAPTADPSETANSEKEKSSAPPASSGNVEVTTKKAHTSGLYAVNPQVPACDVTKLIADLQDNGSAGAAWASVQGIGVGEIASYLHSLTPVVLTQDTRVTNHRYTDGSGVAIQAVLQAGTAVLVDASGVPVVRCACGNPLKPPQPVTGSVTYTGNVWVDFDVTLVVVVQPSPTPLDHLDCVDLTTGQIVRVPVSPQPTSETSEETIQPAPSQSATPGQGPTTLPSVPATPSASATIADPPKGNATNGDYISCASRYGELVRDLTLSGGIQQAGATTVERWAKWAQEAAALAQQGDYAGALKKCEDTVKEMEAVLNGG